MEVGSGGFVVVDVTGNDAPGDVVTVDEGAGCDVVGRGVGSGCRVVVDVGPGLVLTGDWVTVDCGEVSIGAVEVDDGTGGDVVTDVEGGEVVVDTGASSPPPDASAVPATAIPPSTTAPAASTSRLRSKTAPQVREAAAGRRLLTLMNAVGVAGGCHELREFSAGSRTTTSTARARTAASSSTARRGSGTSNTRGDANANTSSSRRSPRRASNA